MNHVKIFSLLVVFTCIVCSYFIRLHQNLYEEVENNKCPFCCGKSLCEILKERQIKLDNSYFLHNVINIFFPNKSVLIAKWENKHVIVKTIGNFNQLSKLECLINDQKLISTFVDVDTVKSHIQNLLHTPLKDNLLQSIRLCPNADHIDFLITPTLKEEIAIAAHLSKESDENLLHNYINIWTLLQINAEPIIQKVLKGWPIATYLGSCGHIIVSEHCGEMLTSYAKKANWNTRVSLSQQLLEAALKFTFDHPNFSFYFTDISADNIAVSEEGILKFIDVENVIIVDKNPTEIPFNWNYTHRSVIYETGVFSFSPEEICSHRISDHNLYAVCQEILGKTSLLIPGGLLNSPPQTLETKINTLLNQCVGGIDRFEAATELLHILQTEV